MHLSRVGVCGVHSGAVVSEDRLHALLAATAQPRPDRRQRPGPTVLPVTVEPGRRIDRADLEGFIVYQLFDAANELLYVGQTTDLGYRLHTHYRDSRFGAEIHHVTYEQVPTHRQMMDREAELIRTLKPTHNTIGLAMPAPIREPSPPKSPSRLPEITDSYLQALHRLRTQQATNAQA